MKLEQWQQVEDLFHAALERPSEERAAFLAAACGANATLHAEVVALLAAQTKPRWICPRKWLAKRRGI